jgi:fumarate reductase subunit D
MIAVVLPFLIGAAIGAIDLVFGIGQPLSTLLAQAWSDAVGAFGWTIVGEVVIGVLAAIFLPAWSLGAKIFALFFS